MWGPLFRISYRPGFPTPLSFSNMSTRAIYHGPRRKSVLAVYIRPGNNIQWYLLKVRISSRLRAPIDYHTLIIVYSIPVKCPVYKVSNVQQFYSQMPKVFKCTSPCNPSGCSVISIEMPAFNHSDSTMQKKTPDLISRWLNRTSYAFHHIHPWKILNTRTIQLSGRTCRLRYHLPAFYGFTKNNWRFQKIVRPLHSVVQADIDPPPRCWYQICGLLRSVKRLWVKRRGYWCILKWLLLLRYIFSSLRWKSNNSV